MNATIVGYACIIDRSNGKSLIKDKIVSQVQLSIPTYTKDNLPKPSLASLNSCIDLKILNLNQMYVLLKEIYYFLLLLHTFLLHPKLMLMFS